MDHQSMLKPLYRNSYYQALRIWHQYSLLNTRIRRKAVMDELSLVKTISGLTTLDEALAAFYLSQAEQFILDYCGLEALPVKLQNTKVQIAAKMIKENTTDSGTKGSAGQVQDSVSSLSDGNQSVSYGASKGQVASFTYDQQSIVDAFQFVLNRYRKLKHDAFVCRQPEGSRRPGGISEVNRKDYYTTPNVVRK